MAKVTIVVVTRGERGVFLAEALRSIAKQTHPCRTLVVVNAPEGCERDKAVNLVARVASCRASLPFEIRVGPGMNHAQGANVALEDLGSAEMVGFLDDDDVLLPDHVALLVGALEASGQRVAYSDSRGVYCDGVNAPLQNEAPIQFAGAFTLGQLRRDNVRPLHSFLFQSWLFQSFVGAPGTGGVRVEPDHELSDWSLLLACAEREPWRSGDACHWAHVPAVTAEYRIRAPRPATTNTDPARVAAGTHVVREFWRRRAAERASS